MIDKYDINNIFAKILRNELPCEKIYEDNDILIIKDKFPDPKWKTHLLCLTKIASKDLTDFICHAHDYTIASFFKKIDEIAKKVGLDHYSLTINNGGSAGQEIMHLHVHIKSQYTVKMED